MVWVKVQRLGVMLGQENVVNIHLYSTGDLKKLHPRDQLLE